MYIIIQAIGKVMFDFFCTFTPTCKQTYTHKCMQSHRQTHKQAGTHPSAPISSPSLGQWTSVVWVRSPWNVQTINSFPFTTEQRKENIGSNLDLRFWKKKVKWWRERSFVFTVGWECARKVALRVSIYSVDFRPVTLSLILAKYSYKFQIAHFKKEHINS